MKNRITIFLMASILLLPNIGLTQNSVRTKVNDQNSSFQIVPQIGTVFSNIRFKDSDSQITPQAGLLVGANFLIPLPSLYLSAETGLFYSRNQYSTKNSSTFGINGNRRSYVSEGEVVVQRLTLPLIARIHPMTRTNGFFVKAGFLTHVQLGVDYEGSEVMVDRDAQGVVNTDSESYQGHYGYAQGLRPIIFDATAGVGYNFELTDSLNMSSELAYQRGLTGLDIEDEDDSQLDTLLLTMGLIF